MRHRHARTLTLAAALVLPLTLAAAAPTPAPAAPAALGRATCAPVAFPADGHTLRGTLCRPRRGLPRAAVVLVHGSASNRAYWDPPGVDPARHSVPRLLAARGYLVANLDRLGFGESDRPATVTATDSIDALHAVVRQLRRDPTWRTSSRTVATVGHSSGSALAIREAATYDDVDLLVVTGLFHTFAEVEPPLFPAMLWDAAADPKFQGDRRIPAGYETTEPATRVLWHFAHTGNSTLRLLEVDERRVKDAQPPGDSGGFEAEVFGQPLAPQVDVPVLSVYGDRDVSRCSAPDPCPQAAAEPGFWPASPDFSLLEVEDTAHAINLHRNARQTTDRIGRWLDRHTTPRP